LAPKIRQCHKDSHFKALDIQLVFDDEENLLTHQAKKLGGKLCIRFGGFFLTDYGRIKGKWSYRISSNWLNIDFRLFLGVIPKTQWAEIRLKQILKFGTY